MSNHKMDERQRDLFSGGMARASVAALLYEIIIIIYKLRKGLKINTEIWFMGIVVVVTLIVYIASAEGSSNRKRSKKVNKTQLNKLDERQRKHRNDALTFGMVVGIIYEFAVIIIKLIQNKGYDYIEVGLLLIVFLIMNRYHMKNKEFRLPKTFFGKELPLGKAKIDRLKRCRYYAMDGLQTSLVLFAFDVMVRKPELPFPAINSKILGYGLDFLARMLLFFILNFLWGEYNVKEHNKFYDSLEDE